MFQNYFATITLLGFIVFFALIPITFQDQVERKNEGVEKRKDDQIGSMAFGKRSTNIGFIRSKFNLEPLSYEYLKVKLTGLILGSKKLKTQRIATGFSAKSRKLPEGIDYFLWGSK